VKTLQKPKGKNQKPKRKKKKTLPKTLPKTFQKPSKPKTKNQNLSFTTFDLVLCWAHGARIERKSR